MICQAVSVAGSCPVKTPTNLKTHLRAAHKLIFEEFECKEKKRKEALHPTLHTHSASTSTGNASKSAHCSLNISAFVSKGTSALWNKTSLEYKHRQDVYRIVTLTSKLE